MIIKRNWILVSLGFCASLLAWTELPAKLDSPPNARKRPCTVTNRSWTEWDYLYWTMQDSKEPIPLVVEGPLSESNVVLGGKGIKNTWRSGAKFVLGYWFDDSHCLGGEISYSFLPKLSKNLKVSSSGLPGSLLLSAPYFNTVTRTEDSTGIALPGSFAGTARLKLQNSMQSAELNILAIIPYSRSLSLNLIAGLRYWNFNEHLSFATDSPYIPPLVDVFQTRDAFYAENHFYGGQVGAKIKCSYDCLFLILKGIVAVGTMHQEVKVKGELLTNDFNHFGAPETFPGGYFALPSNIGHHKADCYAVIPEANISLGYQATEVFSLQIGYTILSVNNVLYAGNELNSHINPTQSAALSDTATPVLVGKALPKKGLKSSNFWAQGLNVCLEFNF